MNNISPEYLLANWRGILQRLKDCSPLVLLADDLVQQVLPLLGSHGIYPDYLLEMDTETRIHSKIEIIHTTQLNKLPLSAGVCICSLNGIELAHTLKTFTDCPILELFLPLGHEMFATHFNPKVIADNIESIRSTRALCHDDASRILFDRIIAFRLTCDLKLIPLPDTPLYGHPQTAPRAGDVIIDAGAYDGDTALSFAASTLSRCKIYSFEPDRRNLHALKQNVNKAKMNAVVEIIPMALWHADEYVFLSGTSTSARIGSNRGQRVRATTLDSFCSERNIKPTLIKTDLEGADINALEGARKTIASCRPRLAISVYHRPEDIWKIPLLAKRLRPDSTLSLVRHAGPESLAEVVLYVYD